MIRIFSAGHSKHSMEYFGELLGAQGTEAVVDVRGRPFSSFFKHFNMQELKKCHGEAGIAYIFLWRELGGRREKGEMSGESAMEYGKILNLLDFQAGVKRLQDIVAAKRTAMVCAEGNPYRCHRQSRSPESCLRAARK